MAKYFQLIYGIDVAVGMIMEELEKQGIADNTVIIYTSDNGYICGSHGYGSKVLPMEESSHAPLMIYDPRSKAAGKKLECAALTGNIDFAPTILDLAGVQIPENMDGESLVPLLKNPDKEIHEQLAFINAWGTVATQSLTCLTKDWKYTYWWYGNEEMKPVEELYDIANDPQEMKNLANEANVTSKLKEMRVKYDKELEKWKNEAVHYNSYQQYVTLFDRTISWEQKEYKKNKNTNEANH
jgi:arylsulfatase A-like enzyme